MNPVARRTRRAARLGRTLAGIAALWCLAIPRPAAAQDDGVQVLLEVLRDVREDLPRGEVALHPVPFCTVRLLGWSCPPEVAAALDSLEIDLGSRAFSHVCPTGPRSCRLLGTDVLLQLSPPEMGQRRAGVWLDVWWRTDGREPAVQHRRTRFELVQRRGRWRVAVREPRVAG